MVAFQNEENIQNWFPKKYFISFLSDKFLTIGISENYDCFKVIKSAVLKSYTSGNNVRAIIGKDLILMLDQMFKLYYQFYEKIFVHERIGKDYNSLQLLLEFPKWAGAPIPTGSDTTSDSSSDDSSDEE